MDQSTISIAFAKLGALRDTLERRLSDRLKQVYPLSDKEYFEKYARCLVILKDQIPHVFGDMPHRPLPQPDSQDVRPVFSRRYMQQLYDDVLEVLGVWHRLTDTRTKPFDVLDRIARSFHRIATQLSNRYNGRATIAISDEYDVQDLLHSLLLIDFADIRKEEWIPSYAGGASRADFLLKRELTIVEVKKTRKGLDDRELGNQLLVDIPRYQKHSDCKSLYCLVYDPEHRIGNPRGIEGDLSKTHGELPVKVVIVP